MHNVKNTAKGHRSLWARQPDGNTELIWLDAGETKRLNVDPADPVFTGGDFKIDEPVKAAAAKPKAAGKTKPGAPKASAPGPAPEPTPEAGA